MLLFERYIGKATGVIAKGIPHTPVRQGVDPIARQL